MTLKFDEWPSKTIGHLFNATLSFVHHFVDICEFRPEFQSGNTQFRSKLVIFFPCDLGIWQMTMKNNRAALLSYFQLCASFCSDLWIQTRVMVKKCPNWGKTFLTCDLDRSYLTLIFCMDIIFVNDNNSWNCHDDIITKTLSKSCDRWTDRWTETFIEPLGQR